MNPLYRLPHIKWRIGAVILSAVSVTVLIFWVDLHLGLWPSVSGVIAAIVALGLTRVLARGMTQPIREIAAAADAMAAGDLDRRVQVTTRDEIGQLAVAFNKMSSQIAQHDRMRRDLVANVSHELRTPITALQAKLENLLDGIESADPETLGTMLRQVERLGRLVTQLLDLSRLEAGQVPLDIQEFQVAPMLKHVAQESQLHSPQVPVEVNVDPQELAATGDPERVHQVIANLVENALRYSPAQEHVEVSARRSPLGVIIEVADHGPGIPPADAQRIFERFYRADSARATNNGGAGIGLSIAQWIVDLHGGEIRPESRQPHGCRMVVTLPSSNALPSTNMTLKGP